MDENDSAPVRDEKPAASVDEELVPMNRGSAPVTTKEPEAGDAVTVGETGADGADVTLRAVNGKEASNKVAEDDVAERPSTSRLRRRLMPLLTGWRTYVRQSVVYAGVSLALLYMTVLGFDSITVGKFHAPVSSIMYRMVQN